MSSSSYVLIGGPDTEPGVLVSDIHNLKIVNNKFLFEADQSIKAMDLLLLYDNSYARTACGFDDIDYDVPGEIYFPSLEFTDDYYVKVNLGINEDGVHDNTLIEINFKKQTPKTGIFSINNQTTAVNYEIDLVSNSLLPIKSELYEQPTTTTTRRYGGQAPNAD